MLQIGKALVSLDVIEKKFVCELTACKGACCVHGDSGAPLEDDEISRLENAYQDVKPYLRGSSSETIEKEGVWCIDSDGDKVTTLVDNKECVFVVFENGVASCAIEKAYFDGKTTFRKPVSCHLYPIRIAKFESFDAVNYHEWEICKVAIQSGTKLGVPLFVFLKDALVRKYGSEWYSELELAAREYSSYKQK